MKIQLKRSNTLVDSKAKAPTSEQMDFGELAVNYSDEDPSIFLKKTGGDIVKIGGSNSVGNDLQAVTDAGNTTTNGATFAGNVAVGNVSPVADSNEGGSILYGSSGGIRIFRSSTGTSAAIDCHNNGTEVWSLQTDGGAKFAGGNVKVETSGRIQTGGTPNGGEAVGTIVDPGVLSICRATGKTVFDVYKTGTIQPTITLESDGSAQFLGKVTARNSTSSGAAVFEANFNGSAKAHILANGSFKIGGDLSSNGNIYLDAGNGRAEFAGNIGLGGPTNAEFRVMVGHRISELTDDPERISLGGTYSNAAGSKAKLLLWDGGGAEYMGLGVSANQLDYITTNINYDHVFYNGSNQGIIETLRITDTGSKFAGDISFAGKANALYYVATRNVETATLFEGILDKDGEAAEQTFIVTADGSAKFAGDISVNGSTLTNTAIGIFTDGSTTNGITVKNTTGSVHSVIRSQDSSGAETAIIKSDGSAAFAGDLITNGQFRIKTEDVEKARINTDGVMCLGNKGNSDLLTGTNMRIIINGLDGSATFDGDVQAVNFNSTSDATLKHNINPIDNALELINEIAGVRYNWNKDDRASAGVLAQDVETVLPELVANGEHKSVNYNGLVGVLVEAVKELSAEVKSLKAKVS